MSYSSSNPSPSPSPPPSIFTRLHPHQPQYFNSSSVPPVIVVPPPPSSSGVPSLPSIRSSRASSANGTGHAQHQPQPPTAPAAVVFRRSARKPSNEEKETAPAAVSVADFHLIANYLPFIIYSSYPNSRDIEIPPDSILPLFSYGSAPVLLSKLQELGLHNRRFSSVSEILNEWSGASSLQPSNADNPYLREQQRDEHVQIQTQVQPPAPTPLSHFLSDFLPSTKLFVDKLSSGSIASAASALADVEADELEIVDFVQAHRQSIAEPGCAALPLDRLFVSGDDFVRAFISWRKQESENKLLLLLTYPHFSHLVDFKHFVRAEFEQLISEASASYLGHIFYLELSGKRYKSMMELLIALRKVEEDYATMIQQLYHFLNDNQVSTVLFGSRRTIGAHQLRHIMSLHPLSLRALPFVQEVVMEQNSGESQRVFADWNELFEEIAQRQWQLIFEVYLKHHCHFFVASKQHIAVTSDSVKLLLKHTSQYGGRAVLETMMELERREKKCENVAELIEVILEIYQSGKWKLFQQIKDIYLFFYNNPSFYSSTVTVSHIDSLYVDLPYFPASPSAPSIPASPLANLCVFSYLKQMKESGQQYKHWKHLKYNLRYLKARDEIMQFLMSPSCTLVDIKSDPDALSPLAPTSVSATPTVHAQVLSLARATTPRLNSGYIDSIMVEIPSVERNFNKDEKEQHFYILFQILHYLNNRPSTTAGPSKYPTLQALTFAVRSQYLADTLAVQKIHSYLTSGECTLFSMGKDVSPMISSSIAASITVYDIYRLIHYSQSSPHTLSYIKFLASSGRSFSSLQALSEALLLCSQQDRQERWKMLTYLMEHGSTLVDGKNVGLFRGYRVVNSTSFHEKALQKLPALDIQAADIDYVFDDSGAGPSYAFQYVKLLESQGRSFASMLELGEAVRHLHMQNEILQFLNSTQCILFAQGGVANSIPSPITLTHLVPLLTESQSSFSLHSYLLRFNSRCNTGARYSSLEKLSVDLYEHHKSSLVERRKVFNFLTQPSISQLFTSLLKPPVISPQMIDDLFIECEKVHNHIFILPFLSSMNSSSLQFTSFPDLQYWLLQKLKDHAQLLNNIFMFFSVESNILTNRKGERIKLSVADIESWVLNHQMIEKNIDITNILQSFHDEGYVFHSLSELGMSVQKEHEFLKYLTQKIYAYLLFPKYGNLLCSTPITTANPSPPIITSLLTSLTILPPSQSLIQCNYTLPISEGDIVYLMKASGANQYLLPFLYALDQHQYRFSTLEDLGNAVKQMYEQWMTDKKKKIINFLMDRTRSNGLFQFSQSSSASFHSPLVATLPYSLLPECCVELTLENYDELFNETGKDTKNEKPQSNNNDNDLFLLSFLQYLTLQQPNYQSFTMLMNGLREIMKSWNKVKVQIYTLLNDPAKSSLLPSNSNFHSEIVTYEQLYHLLTQTTTSIHKPRHPYHASISSLLFAQPLTIYEIYDILIELEANNRKFNSFGHLIQEIQLIQHTQNKEKQKIYYFLSNLSFQPPHVSEKHHHFFDSLPPFTITLPMLNQIYHDSKSQSYTQEHLQSLEKKQLKFGSFSALIEAVRIEHEIAYSDVFKIWKFLQTSTASLFATPPAPAHAPRNNSGMKFTFTSVLQLYQACDSNPATLNYLMTLVSTGQQFPSLSHLISSLRYTINRDRILFWLDSTQCVLFNDSSVVLSSLSESLSNTPSLSDLAYHITPQSIDSLLEQAGTGLSTWQYLQEFQRQNRKYANLYELSQALHEKHEQSIRERQAVIQYLNDPATYFFNQPQAYSEDEEEIYNVPALTAAPIHVLSEDVDTIFDQLGCDRFTLLYLQHFHRLQLKFNSLPQLHAELRKVHEQSLNARMEVFLFLNQHAKVLFYSEKDKETSFSIEQIDDLFYQTKAHSAILSYIKQIQNNSVFHLSHWNRNTANIHTTTFITSLLYNSSYPTPKFTSFSQLIAVVQEIHALNSKEKLKIWKFMNNSERCTLLLGPASKIKLLTQQSSASTNHTTTSTFPSVSLAAIDSLYDSLQSGLLTYPFLFALQSSGFVFNSVEEMGWAIKTAWESWGKDKKKVFEFILSSTFLSDNQSQPQHYQLLEFTASLPSVNNNTEFDYAEFISINDIDVLFEQSGIELEHAEFISTNPGQSYVTHTQSTPLILHYLLQFEQEKMCFHSMESLTQAVTLAHESFLQKVFNFIQQYKSVLFVLGYNQPIHVNDISNLLLQTGAGHSVMVHLNYLYRDHSYQFQSFQHLIDGIKILHARFCMDRTQAFLYLLKPRYTHSIHKPDQRVAHSKQNYLVANSDGSYTTTTSLLLAVAGGENHHLVITLENIYRLFEEVNSGPWTLIHLIRLDEEGKSFRSFEELTQALKLMYEQCRNDRQQLHTYLTHASHHLWSSTPPALATTEIDDMYIQGGAGSSTVALLKLFDVMGIQFQSIQDMTIALKAINERGDHEKLKISKYLKDTKYRILDIPPTPAATTTSSLFVTSPYSSKLPNLQNHLSHLLVPMSKKITMNEIDQIYNYCKIGPHTLRIIQSLDENNNTYKSISELCLAIIDTFEKEIQSKQEVLHYLRNEFVWGSNITSLPSDIEVCIDAYASNTTMHHLQYINAQQQSFSSHDYQTANEVFQHIMELELENQNVEMSIIRWINDRKTCRFAEVGAELNVTHLNEICKELAIQMKQLQQYLNSINAKNKSVLTVDDLKEQVKAEHEFQLIYPLQVKQFLHDAQVCHLFPNKQVPAGVDKLWQTTQHQYDGYLLSYLFALNRLGPEYSSFDSLLVALDTLHQQSMEARRVCFLFLNNINYNTIIIPHQFISAEQFDEYFLSVANQDLYSLLLNIQYANLSFSSYDELFAFIRSPASVPYAIDRATFVQHQRMEKEAKAREFESKTLSASKSTESLFHSSGVPKLSSDVRKQILEELSALPLFEQNINTIVISAEALDTLVHEGEGREALMNKCNALIDQQKTFNTFPQLIEAVIDFREHEKRPAHEPAAPSTPPQAAAPLAENAPPLSPNSQSTLVEYLSSCELFTECQGDLELEQESLDRLIYQGGGLQHVLTVLRKFDSDNVKFLGFHEVLPAVQKFNEQKLHDRQVFVDYLNDFHTTIFSQVDNDLNVSEEDIDNLIQTGKSIQNLLFILKGFDALNRKFYSFNELFPAVKLVVDKQDNDRCASPPSSSSLVLNHAEYEPHTHVSHPVVLPPLSPTEDAPLTNNVSDLLEKAELVSKEHPQPARPSSTLGKMKSTRINSSK